MTNQEDRRIRKTKTALQESLAELCEVKELHKITIKELTETADIHRSTFYVHYQDIFMLYEEIEDKVIFELKELIQTHFTLDLTIYYQILLEYVDQNKRFCKMLFSPHVPISFLERLTVLFKNACFKSWGEILGKTEVSEALTYLADYHVQGSFTIIRKWTESNFSYSKEKLATIISGIDFQIIEGLTHQSLELSDD